MTDKDEENKSSSPVPDRPGAGWVLADIERFVDFRKEYYKYSITIATALLAFTISFPPTLTMVEWAILARIAWVALGISILCGVTAHYAWSRFYISFRDFDNRGQREEGKQYRRTWTGLRRALEAVQFFSLIVGVLGIALFASINYQHVGLHVPDNNVQATPAQPHP